MPRRLRIETWARHRPLMVRGNGRQKAVRDHADRGRLVDGLQYTVVRYDRGFPCGVIMRNHGHLVRKSPRPDVCGPGFRPPHSRAESRPEGW
jgi:hypothetical protein